MSETNKAGKEVLTKEHSLKPREQMMPEPRAAPIIVYVTVRLREEKSLYDTRARSSAAQKW